MRKGILFAVSCCALIFASCGPRWDRGKQTTQQQQVAAFSAIDISAPVTAIVTVRPGAVPSVALKGYSGDLKEIRTEVNDNTLKIYSEKKHWLLDFDEEAVRVEITVPALSGMSIAGVAEVKTLGVISSPAFTLDVAGAGDVTIEELITDNLTVDAAGASDIKIKKGNARHAEYDFSGAGDLNAYGLSSEEVQAEISGAGDMKVTVNQSLSASISGAGDIKYKGHPAVVKDVSGIGTISDAN